MSTQPRPYNAFSADVTDYATLLMSEGIHVTHPATVSVHLET
jgi:hypothetical protein